MNYLGIIIEFLGSFIFLSVIVATGNPVYIGATLAALIFLGANISGGHFNPAVTCMSLYNKDISVNNAIAFVMVQILAGILAVTSYNILKK